MAKEFEQSETGNWNVADKWSDSMIFTPFREASDYLRTAHFGCSDLFEDFTFDETTKIAARIKSLKWAKYCIEQGIRQCLFAIRNKTDKDKLTEYLGDLEKYAEVIDSIEEIRIYGDEKKSEINQEVFDFVYNALLKIYTNVTEPMNRSDLIFTHREDYDPKKFKESIKERFKEGE